jgi:ABC-type branched-subunit amino acid transport system substrate-binding protein
MAPRFVPVTVFTFKPDRDPFVSRIGHYARVLLPVFQNRTREAMSFAKPFLAAIFVAFTLLAAPLGTGPARAEDVYKIGVSVGLSGYVSSIDQPWRDGLEVAVTYVNARGGIMGRKVQLIVEDNKSQPEEAYTIYRKMINADKVDIFLSGCLAAGNFAGLPFVMRAKIPVVLCSILPPDQLEWAYSIQPPPWFEVQTRLAYLKTRTQVRKAGVLHDHSAYGAIQRDIARKIAPAYGIEIPVVEQYRQDDADIGLQVGKINAAGLKALVKLGVGKSTLTVAKETRRLGLDTLLLGSTDDLAIFTPVAEVLGEQYLFVVMPAQVYESLPDGPLKQEIGRFLLPWRAKYGDRDPGWAGRAWDAVMLAAAAVEKAKSFDGPKVRDALETLTEFQGTGGVYNFSPSVHQGITQNPYLIATIVDGKVQVRQ